MCITGHHLGKASKQFSPGLVLEIVWYSVSMRMKVHSCKSVPLASLWQRTSSKQTASDLWRQDSRVNCEKNQLKWYTVQWILSPSSGDEWSNMQIFRGFQRNVREAWLFQRESEDWTGESSTSTDLSFTLHSQVDSFAS